MTDRPPFELEPYEDSSLEHNKMLTRDLDLVGHTIKACITSPSGQYAEPGCIVLVTETMCWAEIRVTGYNFEDAYCELQSRSQTYAVRGEAVRDLTIHDFLSATDLSHEGLISDAEFNALREREQIAEKAEKAAKAELLRKQLAQLEGGAA